MMEEIIELVKISNEIGKLKNLVQAGGGNTSVKTSDGRMIIKASGFTFSDMTEQSGFVVLDYNKIVGFFKSDVNSLNAEENEKGYDNILMGSRTDSNFPRPSMEAGMHIFLDRAVIHTHPVMVNIINCMKGGEKIAQELFSSLTPDFLWVDYKSPGYNLAREIKNKVSSYESVNGVKPKVIFLKNHGLIVSSDDSSECVSITIKINEKIFEHLKNTFGLEPFPNPEVRIKDGFYFNDNSLIKDFVKDPNEGKRLLSNFLIPDDVVYCSEFVLQENLSEIDKTKINFVADEGVVYPWENKKAIKINEMLMAKIYILSALNKIGKPDYLKDEDVNYILNMESEKYRQKLNKN